MGRRRPNVHASLARGDGDVLGRRRSDANLGQSARALWSERDRTRSEMVLERAGKDMKTVKERP